MVMKKYLVIFFISLWILYFFVAFWILWKKLSKSHPNFSIGDLFFPTPAIKEDIMKNGKWFSKGALIVFLTVLLGIFSSLIILA
jgi:hypothetical protein